ncbi:MAG: AMIN domain-containing protein [Desulfobulbaceae bacterium]|nr:AMIN domain-containing protein [Desulfobulbaceae bacterium]
MLDYIAISSKNSWKRFYNCLFIMMGFLLFTVPVEAAGQGDNDVSTTEINTISQITAKTSGNNLELVIQGNVEPVYTVYELPNQFKIVVDIANGGVRNPADLVLPRELNIKLATKVITNVDPDLLRIEFALPQSYPFKTSQKENTVILIIEDYLKKEAVAATADSDKAKDKVKDQPLTTAPAIATKDGSRDKETRQSIESQLPQVDPLQVESDVMAESDPQNLFNFSGYNKKRITVDFYKIDLHNVFRMLKEISGSNIIVTEGVSGTLTLALDDVPWDFALDIILNLKDLKKEERYNTIIIHPKSMVFTWPERAEENLTIEADKKLTKQEAIVIQRQQSQPVGVVEAKKLIGRGRMAEKNDDLENAVQLYEKALEKWPENGKLANKISSIYLVQLRQNAKAVYFADKALAVDKTNGSAALNAAIAHANMRENGQAQQYFDQSVSAGKPSREALMSYAAFSEDQRRYDAAVKLLQKNDKLYGQDLQSMVAQARILEKQGKHESATEVYKAILLTGFRIPTDLRRFITDRINLSQSM